MTQPKPARVSVAMATYNGAAFIEEQLASLASQTMLPSELIICDDQSLDDTAERAERFARHAPFSVYVVRNATRLGYAENFLSAAARCTGDYVAFCDQDDVWDPAKLAIAAERLRTTGAGLFAHEAATIDRKGKRIGKHSHDMTEGLYQPMTLPPWGVFFGFACVVSRELLTKLPSEVRPIDENAGSRMAHDRWVYFLANTFAPIYVSERELVSYRQHGANVFGHRPSTRLALLLKFVGSYRTYLERHRALAAERRDFIERYLPSHERTANSPAGRAVAIWSEQEALFALRLGLLRGNPLRRRIWSVAALSRRRAYRPHFDGGFGRRGLWMDVAAAALRL